MSQDIQSFQDKNMQVVGDTVDGTNGISQTLKFLHADYSIHGDYICTAENFADRAEKLFHVYVEGLLLLCLPYLLSYSYIHRNVL
jgi:hypothetical protein